MLCYSVLLVRNVLDREQTHVTVIRACLGIIDLREQPNDLIHHMSILIGMSEDQERFFGSKNHQGFRMLKDRHVTKESRYRATLATHLLFQIGSSVKANTDADRERTPEKIQSKMTEFELWAINVVTHNVAKERAEEEKREEADKLETQEKLIAVTKALGWVQPSANGAAKATLSTPVARSSLSSLMEKLNNTPREY
jgi:hypothetical protein